MEADLQTHELLSTEMREKIARTLKLTRREVACMNRFIQAAKRVEVMLGTRADVHCLISLHDNSVVPGIQAIAPVHSKLFLRQYTVPKLLQNLQVTLCRTSLQYVREFQISKKRDILLVIHFHELCFRAD